MDDRTTLRRRRTRLFRGIGWLAVAAITAIALVGPAAGPVAAQNAGAIWTTGETCQSPALQDQNLYQVGDTVHIRGKNLDASTLHYWRIVAVNVQGKPVIASGDATTDVDGYFCVAAHTIGADEAGAEYSVDVDTSADFHGAKNDNYRVATPDPGSLLVTKALAGDLTGFAGGDFTFSVTCGTTTYDPITINLTSGSASAAPITGIPAGAECTVTETAKPPAGTGGSWDSPAAGQATIASGQQASVTITNTRSYSPPPPPGVPGLTIAKSVTGNTNGTDATLGVPSAAIGDTLTFTLTYTLVNGPVTGAVITDVLPEGYGTPAVNDGGVYDEATRTITWLIGTGDDPRTLSASGSVSYSVVVLEGADELEQPLTNVATIASDATDPASDRQQVAVAGQVEEATATPKTITPPPTDALGLVGGSGSDNWRIVLLAIAGLLAAILLLTPAHKAVARRRR